MSTLPSPLPITTDLPCLQCCYNLRTRLPTDLCPECATPVAASLQHHNESSTFFTPHPRTMTAGLTFTALAFLLPFLYHLTLPRPIDILLTFAWQLLLAIGALLIIHAVARSRASIPNLRPLSLLFAIVFLSTATITTILDLYSWPDSADVEPTPFATYTAYALRDAESLSRTLLFLALACQLLRIARRLRAPKLQVATWLISLPLALMYFSSSLGLLLAQIALECHLTSPAIETVYSLETHLYYPYVISALAMPILLFQFHRLRTT